jgi:hypothetical protein
MTCILMVAFAAINTDSSIPYLINLETSKQVADRSPLYALTPKLRLHQYRQHSTYSYQSRPPGPK